MKVSSLALAGLAGSAAANELEARYKTNVEVECHPTATVTVTAGQVKAQDAAPTHELSSNTYTTGDHWTAVTWSFTTTDFYCESAGVYKNPYNPAQTWSAPAAQWTQVEVPHTTSVSFLLTL